MPAGTANVDAALTAKDVVTVAGNSTVDGHDAEPAGWAGSCGPLSDVAGAQEPFAVERAGQEVIRDTIRLGGGHATLIRAPDTVRASADVFHPQAAALAALSARVKETQDPKRIFNPGRMYAGV